MGGGGVVSYYGKKDLIGHYLFFRRISCSNSQCLKNKHIYLVLFKFSDIPFQQVERVLLYELIYKFNSRSWYTDHLFTLGSYIHFCLFIYIYRVSQKTRFYSSFYITHPKMIRFGNSFQLITCQLSPLSVNTKIIFLRPAVCSEF